MNRDWGVTRGLVDRRPDWSIPIVEVLSLPGDLVVVVFLLGLLYLGSVWSRRKRQNEALCDPRVVTTVAIVFGGLALVVLLESIVGAGRPPADWQAIDPSPHGFPSGHTMAATILWGAVAWRHWSVSYPRMVLAVGGIVSLVAISRLVLGVHYLPDVLGAVLVGIIYLGLANRLVEDRPAVAFGGAILIAIGGFVIGGGTGRVTVALAGTLAAGGGWYLTERPPVRNGIRALFRRLAG